MDAMLVFRLGHGVTLGGDVRGAPLIVPPLSAVILGPDPRIHAVPSPRTQAVPRREEAAWMPWSHHDMTLGGEVR